MFLLVFLKSREGKVDEIEFRGNERDHRRATFKTSANWCNMIVTEETNLLGSATPK